MKKTSIALFAFFASVTSWAGLGTSLMQTAPVVPVGEAELKFQSDIIFNRGGGFNLSPHIETGLIEHYFDIDAFVGAGTTDFQAGALGKFNLLPDIDGQIGLSFLGGFSYIRDESLNSGLLTIGILISKKIQADFGLITPYSAFELETHFHSSGNTVPLTLLLGSKWQPESTKPWSLYSELALNLHESFYALSLGAAYPF